MIHKQLVEREVPVAFERGQIAFLGGCEGVFGEVVFSVAKHLENLKVRTLVLGRSLWLLSKTHYSSLALVIALTRPHEPLTDPSEEPLLKLLRFYIHILLL